MSNISPFGQNEWLVEEMYRKFRDDPSSVDPSWHEFLVDYNPEPIADTDDGQAAEANAPAPEAKPAAPAAPQPTGGNG
ncbi:2-oxoglutarate dehydrogenase E1 subunit family protein, partial [Mycobacterium interjectum]|uniref:2-oxoglutarate dehydrogenase E1 subunit family protein n=1 Tax=Mycobacterium interjectum TaxID=33895 RepID=UPI0021F31A8B